MNPETELTARWIWAGIERIWYPVCQELVNRRQDQLPMHSLLGRWLFRCHTEQREWFDWLINSQHIYQYCLFPRALEMPSGDPWRMSWSLWLQPTISLDQVSLDWTLDSMGERSVELIDRNKWQSCA
jgi:hypothetical protein